MRRFSSHNINKVMTIESSGIAPAIMVGAILNVPVLFAKKTKPSTMQNVLFIDDFLANGNAAKGILDIVNQAGATLEGMGFLIEKGFQEGGKYLRSMGVHVESLAIIDSLEDCKIRFKYI